MTAVGWIGLYCLLAGLSLLGGTLHLAARRRPRQRAELWLGLLGCAVAFTQLAGALVLARPVGVGLDVALFVRTAATAACVALGIVALARLVPGIRMIGPVLVAVGAITAFRLIVWFPTDLMIRHETTADGWPRYGPLDWTALLPGILLLPVAIAAVRRASPLVRLPMAATVVATAVLTALSWLVESPEVSEELVSLVVEPAALGVLWIFARRVVRTARARDRLMARQDVLLRLGRDALHAENFDFVRRQAESELRGQVHDGIRLLMDPDRDDLLGAPGATLVARGRRHVGVAIGLGDVDDSARSFVESVLQIVVAGADRVASEFEIAYGATHDEVTGLANQVLFTAQLADRLATERTVMVVVVGVGGFAEVAAEHGTPAQDAVAAGIASRLIANAGPLTAVGRLTSSVFAVVESLPAADHAGHLAVRLKRLRSALEAPGRDELDRARIALGAAVSSPGSAAHELIGDAMAALGHAVESGLGTEIFDAELGAELRERLETERALAHALETDEIGISYQAIVDARTRWITGYEALARWRHGDRVIPPDEWIPIAERTGLIHEIGLRLLAMACHDQAELGVPVSVNVSPLQLSAPDFADRVFEVLGATPPDRLVIEVTESAVMDDIARASRTLSRLRRAGVSVALDDFGTSYSSLSVLVDLPVDILKIDRSFIGRITARRPDPVIPAIVSLARAVGAITVAEGVETALQADALVTMGIDRLQGFAVGRPTGVRSLAAPDEPPLPRMQRPSITISPLSAG